MTAQSPLHGRRAEPRLVVEGDLSLEAADVLEACTSATAVEILASTSNFEVSDENPMMLDRFATALRLAAVKRLRLLELDDYPSPTGGGLPAAAWADAVASARRLVVDYHSPRAWALDEDLVTYLVPQETWLRQRSAIQVSNADAAQVATAAKNRSVVSARLLHTDFARDEWMFDGIDMILSDGARVVIDASGPPAASPTLDFLVGPPGGDLTEFHDPLALCERHLRFETIHDASATLGVGGGFGELRLALTPNGIRSWRGLDVIAIRANHGRARLHNPPRLDLEHVQEVDAGGDAA